jgi:hypothetical protein
MKNKLKFFLLLFVSGFIIFNILIVILWPLITTKKFSKYNPYSEVELKSLNLNKPNALKLYLETWQRERLYEYDEYTGIVESNSKNADFVNTSKEFGRKILNKDCSRNIFFYGGENMFGYNVTDTQTIPYYFKEIIDSEYFKENYCIYNFGRGTYNSTQENLLFIKHILSKKILNEDIVIFFDGVNEKGNREVLNTKFISDNYNGLHQKYWLLYKYTFFSFIKTIPSSQLSELLIKKYINRKVEKNNKKELDYTDITRVFNDNIKIRNSICNKFTINCYNFLQPFPELHGKFYNYNNNIIETFDINKDLEFYKTYSLLREVNGVFDISDSLKNSFGISYIQKIYYSPESNKLLAKRIYDYVKRNLN